jgi:hypothetical protein
VYIISAKVACNAEKVSAKEVKSVMREIEILKDLSQNDLTEVRFEQRVEGDMEDG